MGITAGAAWNLLQIRNTMSEKFRKGILGGIAGLVVGVSMELLKGGGYLEGSNMGIRALLAGTMGFLVFTGLNAMSCKSKDQAAEKK